MKTDTRLGTVEEVTNDYPPEVMPIVNRLRDLIIELNPDTTEQPRPGDRALSYGLGPKKMTDGYAYIMAQKVYVNLGFYKGAALPDPDGLLEGTGKMLRHIKVCTAAQVDDPALRQLLVEAIAERRKATGAS